MSGSEKLIKYAYKIGGGYFTKINKIEILTMFPISFFKLQVSFKQAKLMEGYGQYKGKKILRGVLVRVGGKRKLNEILMAIKIGNKLYKVKSSSIDGRTSEIIEHSFLLEEVYKER